MGDLDALRWDGGAGHYEVHYLTLTDPVSGIGLWIRFTLLAPEAGPATCALWFVATRTDGPAIARKVTLPASALVAAAAPFALRIGDGQLTTTGSTGTIGGDAAWDLRWEPGPSAEHVGPLLRRAGVAQTVLVLPGADLRVSGTLTVPGLGPITLEGVHAGRAHLWGTRHSERWVWAHCGDFAAASGEPRPGTFLDGVSVLVRRAGREAGPASPVVGRFLDEDFAATGPLSLVRARSRFGLTSWALEATSGPRRVRADVFAPRASLAGVVYADPDGRRAWCYNSEVASMRVTVRDRAAGRWTPRETLVSDGRAHFEYGQRAPVPGLETHLP